MVIFPPNPPWFVPYGMVPSDLLDEATGILLQGMLGHDKRGSTEQQKASFHYRVFGWGATSVIEYPLEVEVFQASLTAIRGQIFVSGLGTRGKCLQQIPGVGAAVLSEPESLPFAVDDAASYDARPIVDARLKDRLWRARPRTETGG